MPACSSMIAGRWSAEKPVLLAHPADCRFLPLVGSIPGLRAVIRDSLQGSGEWRLARSQEARPQSQWAPFGANLLCLSAEMPPFIRLWASTLIQNPTMRGRVSKLLPRTGEVEKRGRMASPSRGEKDRVAASRARGARASRAPPGRCGPRGACAVSGARRWPDGTQRPARPCWSRARRSRRASRGCRPPWP